MLGESDRQMVGIHLARQRVYIEPQQTPQVMPQLTKQAWQVPLQRGEFLRGIHQIARLSCLPGVGISQDTSSPVPTIVMYAFLRSAPPKQMFEGNGSGGWPGIRSRMKSITFPSWTTFSFSGAMTVIPPGVPMASPLGSIVAT